MKRIVKLYIKTLLILGSSLTLFYYAISCYSENHIYITLQNVIMNTTLSIIKGVE